MIPLFDFCAKHGFEGLDATGYFFPGHPKVPADEFVNNLKRRAFDLGIGISGTGVRNNLTTANKAVRAASVQHITIIRLSGYRGYLPIETLSASGQEYDPFVVVPKFLAELRQR